MQTKNCVSEEVKEILNLGFERTELVDLYKTKLLNQKKISEKINKNYNLSFIVSPKHISALLKYFEIAKWTKAESDKAYLIHSVEVVAMTKKAELESVGLSITGIEDMYKNGMSKEDIIKLINSYDDISISKNSIKMIWDHFNLFTRTEEEDNTLRMSKINDALNKQEKIYGDNYSADEIVKLYLSGLSIRKVVEKTGSNIATVSKLVKAAGYEIRKDKGNRFGVDGAIEKIKENGISYDMLVEMYNNSSSNTNFANQLNEKINGKVIHRNIVNGILKHYQIDSKASKKNYNRSKTYGNGITREEAIIAYKRIGSLQKVYEEYGISPSILSSFLKEEGISTKTQKNVIDVIKDLEDKGIGREEMLQKYHVQNISSAAMVDWLDEISDDKITSRTFGKIVNIMSLQKNEILVKQSRGRKSREEMQENLISLKSAGFDSREDLAQYFHDNKRLTYKRLVKELNNSIGEDLFSYRWLERHMAPYMPADRLVGVSRGELGLLEFIKTFYNGEVITGDRQIIRPKELDIVLPELKLAIEFNGDYWHSDKFTEENHGMTSFEYHARKQHDARLQGYSLVFVWESDWEGNADAVESSVERFILSGGSQVDSSLLRLS